jgi:SAM-dependent methyltransferase
VSLTIVVRALRATGLLGLADRLRFLRLRRRSRDANRAFVAANPGFALPPADLAFDAYGHVDWAGYRISGEQQASGIAEVIRAAFPDGPLAVLEWGCGPGRLIRHMPGLLGPRPLRIVGADYNPRSVEWNRRNLPGIDFVQNDLRPPFALPDDHFDAVYCISVFTHLSEDVQLEWAAELRRILKPGGLLICTTQGDAFRRVLVTDAERARYDNGEVVVLGKYREGRKYFLAIHPERFVRDNLLAGYQGVRRLHTRAMKPDFFQQDAWIGWKHEVPEERDARLREIGTEPAAPEPSHD